MLLSVLMMVVYPAGAMGQEEETTVRAVNLTINEQNCNVVINQYNNAVAGDAFANGDEAAAAVAVKIDAPVSVVQNCIQGDNNSTGGGSGDEGSDDGDTGDEGDEGDTDTGGDGSGDSVEFNEQNCNVVINQYNNAIAGSATANGEAAIAAVAAEVNAPINVVQNCIQGDNNGGGSNGGGSTTPDNPPAPDPDNDPADTPRATASDDNDSVMKGTFDENKTLANTGGETVGFVEASPVSSVMVPVGGLLAASSLVGVFWLVRRADGER